MEEKRILRIFTKDQKFEMVQHIETCLTLKEGLAKHQFCYSALLRTGGLDILKCHSFRPGALQLAHA